MTPKYVVLHHSAVKAGLKDDQYKGINKTHKERFNFPSKLTGSYVGYHYLIRPDGLIAQTRGEDEVGAHCIESDMNFKSIGICLQGHFDVQNPTDRQIFALRDLLKRLSRKYGIKKEAIMFHHDFASYKSCPGNNIKRDFIRGLIT